MGSVCERSSPDDVSAKDSDSSAAKKNAYRPMVSGTKNRTEENSSVSLPQPNLGNTTSIPTVRSRTKFRRFSAVFPNSAGITSLVCHPGFGDTCVLVASETGSIALFDYDSGKTHLRWEKVHEREINALTAPLLDSGHFLSCSRDKKIKLWSSSMAIAKTEDGDEDAIGKSCKTPLAELIGHTLTVSSVDLHPQGHLAVSGSRDNTVRLWDLSRDGEEVFCGNIKLNLVYFVHFLPSLSCVIQGGEDRTIRMWDLRCGQSKSTLVLAHTLEPDLKYFPTCALSLASACPDSPNGSGGNPYHLITGHNGVNGCGSFIKEWDLRRPDQDAVYTHTEAHQNSVTGLLPSSSRASPLSFLSYSVDSVVNLWEKASTHPSATTTLRDQLNWNEGHITALACARGNHGSAKDPSDLVIGTRDGAVTVLRQEMHPNCHRKLPREQYRLFAA